MEYVLNSLQGTMSPLKGTEEWLYQNDASLAITSYQTGGLILVGFNKMARSASMKEILIRRQASILMENLYTLQALGKSGASKIFLRKGIL